MTPEHALQNTIRLEAAKSPNLILWRNNVGEGWQGDSQRSGDTVLIKNARVLHAGLCKGSSDLIGIRKITVTQEMVGATIGQFVALEVKMPGKKVLKDQQNFLGVIESFSGFSKVVRSAVNVWSVSA